MPSELPDKVQGWTAKRRAAVALMILKGETSSQEVARKYGLRVAEVEEWRDRFLMGAENELRSRPRDEVALRDAQI
jgi:transposase-like protein